MTNQPSNGEIHFGVLGPGRAAARFAQGLAAVPGATLAAVWGRNTDRARAYAQRFAVPRVATEIDDLFGTDVDAIYVATHPDTHAGFCIRALLAGKHVLCEKPSALNQRQLAEILAAAHLHDRLFMEAMKPPFFPLYQRLRRHLADDPIGPIGFVRAGHSDSSIGPDYPLHFAEPAPTRRAHQRERPARSRRCLDRLRPHPAIAALVNACTQTATSQARPQRTERVIFALSGIPGKPRDPGHRPHHHSPYAQNSLICLPKTRIVIDYRRRHQADIFG